MWPGSNGAITRRILHIVSAEKQRAKESGVVGLTAAASVCSPPLHRIYNAAFLALCLSALPMREIRLVIAPLDPSHEGEALLNRIRMQG